MEFCQLATCIYLWLNVLILNQYKGNNSGIIDDIQTKFDVHQGIMVICIPIKFHQILLIGYLVMAPDGHDTQNDGPTDWRKLYPSAFGQG